MIRHIVMWQLLPQAGGHPAAENARQIKTLIEALPGHIPEILELEIGLNQAGIAGNHDVVLNAVFADLEALQRYQDHPEHRKVATVIAGLRSSRAAVDYQF